MASLTVDGATDWPYVDKFGVKHNVSAGQTFTINVTDGGVSEVEYDMAGGSVATSDGRKVHIRRSIASAGNGNQVRKAGFITDAGQGSDFYGTRGEFIMLCPESGEEQRWSIAKINPQDAELVAGSLTWTLEDQFGNSMTGTFSAS